MDDIPQKGEERDLIFKETAMKDDFTRLFGPENLHR